MFRLKEETDFKSNKTNQCNLNQGYIAHSTADQGLFVQTNLVSRPALLCLIVISGSHHLALAAQPSPFKVMQICPY